MKVYHPLTNNSTRPACISRPVTHYVGVPILPKAGVLPLSLSLTLPGGW